MATTAQSAFRRLSDQLSACYDLREAQSIARIVVEDAFGFSPVSAQILDTTQLKELEAITARLLKKEPVQYVLGRADFYGLKLEVSPAVLIPRQETEELVQLVLQSIPSGRITHLRLLDIGTGSGCIPIAVKKHRPEVEVWGLDVSQAAMETAFRNGVLNQVEVNWLQMDILDRAAWTYLRKWDILVSNPPYIPGSEMHLVPDHVTQYEPHLALFVADADPLLFYRTILDFSLEHLNQGGRLFFELNEFNTREVADLARAAGYREVEIVRDLSGKERMLSLGLLMR